MKFTAQVRLLGFESKRSAKGNDYLVGLFQQGMSTMQCMVKVDDLGVLTQVKVDSQIEIVAERNNYGNFTVIDMKPALSAVDKKAV